jgi:hypothetical protein
MILVDDCLDFVLRLSVDALIAIKFKVLYILHPKFTKIENWAKLKWGWRRRSPKVPAQNPFRKGIFTTLRNICYF